jgi:hypothetical protein
MIVILNKNSYNIRLMSQRLFTQEKKEVIEIKVITLLMECNTR